MEGKISFTINGKPYQVGSETRADTPLVEFLRKEAGLTGTKYMCKEGGCGACVITLTRNHPLTQQGTSYAVNACLTPVLACHGGAITTVEGIGNRMTGYSRVQAALAKCGGTQCGFCSPGMVMNMYSLLASKNAVVMKDIEDSFGGNVCRCTGYRPILDAFKSLSVDATPCLKEKVADIEDLWNICLNGRECSNSTNCCLKLSLPIENKYSTPAWFIPNSISQLMDILKSIDYKDYFLLAGNTARGVYKQKERPLSYININYINALKKYKIRKEYLELGASMTLSEIMDLFYRISKEQPHFSYLKILADHLQLVANIPVRNVGTLAGNLIIKNKHPEFPSDLFVMLETVNALMVTDGQVDSPKPLSHILQKNIEPLIIIKVILPPLSEEYKLKTFKVMSKAQNVYAHVNAGFLFKVDSDYRVKEKPNIVYGGISSTFVHAKEAEKYFSGLVLLDGKVFQKGLSILSNEINPLQEGFQASSVYRKKLALNLFYKFVLGLKREKLRAELRSGGDDLDRPLSRGLQSFQTKKERWPLTKPLNKLESIIQCSGEAEYVNDIPEAIGQLYGTLVLAEQVNAIITDIDPSSALEMEGVIAFYSAKDIPGKNLFMAEKDLLAPEDEELFCSGRVLYGGQPVGIVVAESQELAEEASGKIVIEYEAGEPPALSVKDLLKQNKTSRITSYNIIQPEEAKLQGNAMYEIKGEVELGPQYHFTLEPQTCVCIPMEDGLQVYPATQWMANVQESIARVLKIPENLINMQVRRLGGGFGSKITRATMVATACALAAYKLNRPVKVVLDIETNMKAIGKRNSAYSKYEVGFDESGRIERLKVWLCDDMGCSNNDPAIMIAEPGIRNCYESSRWEMHLSSAVTDTPGSSWMRAPGTIEALATIEEIMEHISYVLKLDPLQVRLNNFGEFPLLKSIISEICNTSDYYDRRKNVQSFNMNNRWKKRGISILPMVFHLEYFFTLNAMISIYADDGSVAITHGGVEMGQGVNTKAVQMCAATLGIDTNKIKVKPTSVMTSPNACLTGASITSDCVAHSVKNCCDILNQRLKRIKDKMPGASWEDIIAAAHEDGIDLNASFLNRLQDGELKNYYIHAAAVTEVEVDILTGQYQILRTDILEDAGESMNPEVDLGQIEGGFVMGLGYFLLENIELDPNTGVTITNNTARYWVPGPKDIPIDFRVSLLSNTSNANGVARSKATGEPPICLALSALFALRNAVIAARHDTQEEKWLPLCQPFSVEKICLAANTQEKDLCI